MTEVTFRIENLRAADENLGGILATFDIAFCDVVVTRGWSVQRVAADGHLKLLPSKARLAGSFPYISVENHRLRAAIALRAAQILETAGDLLRNADFTVEHEPESDEDAAAGLRRVIGETCQMAGLGL